METHLDLFLGKDGVSRIQRLATSSGSSHSEVARRALIEYEVGQSLMRDTVRDATLELIQACMPDELYDPAEDPRQGEAVRRLGELLGSAYAAEGIQLAIMRVVAQGITETTNRQETLS